MQISSSDKVLRKTYIVYGQDSHAVFVGSSTEIGASTVSDGCRTYKVRQAYGKMYVVISLFNIYVYLHDASYW